jgi:hypothetical protein
VVAVARKLAASGAAVVLIHHNPKSGEATPRGHSVLNGALDVAMLVAKEESGLIRGRLTKNRNGAVDRDLVFRVGVVGLGTDADGDPITAAVAEEVQHVPAKAPKLSERTRFCLDVLYRLTEAIHPDSPDKPVNAGQVSEDDWRATFIDQMPAGQTPDSKSRAFIRASSTLVLRNIVTLSGGYVTIVGAVGQAGQVRSTSGQRPVKSTADPDLSGQSGQIPKGCPDLTGQAAKDLQTLVEPVA